MEIDHGSRGRARSRCREYLLALEDERRKIQVFQRELPLCLDLVTQTIEGMRSQMDGTGSEETVSDNGPPVLEEFIPLKPSLSLSSSEEGSTHAATATATATATAMPIPSKKLEQETPEENKTALPDWLQSVQLWSQEPHPSSPTLSTKELPCKPVALNARKAGGAFHPFEREKKHAELPASSTTAAESSVVVGDSGDKPTEQDTEKLHNKVNDHEEAKDTEKEKDKDAGTGTSSQAHRKQRRCWEPELHRRFLQALQQLGGSHAATPKQIREMMKVDGLTNDEVKSHLQKYRLHTRRPSSAMTQSTTAPPPTPQFVVVGSIWVPQPEYAAATAAQQNPDASASTNTLYAPVAMLPSGLQHQGQMLSGRCSEGLRSGDSSSSSPAISSSSQTTSAQETR